MAVGMTAQVGDTRRSAEVRLTPSTPLTTRTRNGGALAWLLQRVLEVSFQGHAGRVDVDCQARTVEVGQDNSVPLHVGRRGLLTFRNHGYLELRRCAPYVEKRFIYGRRNHRIGSVAHLHACASFFVSMVFVSQANPGSAASVADRSVRSVAEQESVVLARAGSPIRTAYGQHRSRHAGRGLLRTDCSDRKLGCWRVRSDWPQGKLRRPTWWLNVLPSTRLHRSHVQSVDYRSSSQGPVGADRASAQRRAVCATTGASADRLNGSAARSTQRELVSITFPGATASSPWRSMSGIDGSANSAVGRFSVASWAPTTITARPSITSSRSPRRVHPVMSGPTCSVLIAPATAGSRPRPSVNSACSENQGGDRLGGGASRFPAFNPVQRWTPYCKRMQQMSLGLNEGGA
jgi:hypothetical protein